MYNRHQGGDNLKCLFCSSEAVPFAASGGLAEVSGSLPHALVEKNIDCRVVMPLYGGIAVNLREEMQFLTSFSVPLSWRNQYCGVFKSYRGGVIYYFIDNEYYFKRGEMYGHYDDAERFSFFSRAILEMLSKIDFRPDVIHANDWQTAMVPVYYSAFYGWKDWYRGIKTLFTIHNIQYQGKYGMDIAGDVLGLPQHSVPLIELDKCANLMKGAIECSDRVSTVSKSYASEILNPWYSWGLDDILRERRFKLSGILNGIDTKSYNPQTDSLIYADYSAGDMSGKEYNKQCLQERLGLTINPEIPLISVVGRLTGHKGMDLIMYALDSLLASEDIQFVVLGSGEKEYEEFFRAMMKKYKGRVTACLGFIPELSRKIYAGSDMFLMPSKSEPCGLAQMMALRYGSIPIVRETGGLCDTVKDSGDGKGNGFTFKTYDAMDMASAIKRAIEGYKDKIGWSILMKRAMLQDNSWGASAQQYLDLYRDMTKFNKDNIV